MITIKDKQFVPFLSQEEIRESVAALAARIDRDYAGRNPLLVSILAGSYIFAADLTRAITIPHEIDFVRLSSYNGLNTTGKVQQLMGTKIDMKDRDVIIVEDLIDTGETIYQSLPSFQEHQPKSVEVCAFLCKPDKIRVPLNVKYYAREIPEAFIVGYGMDYDEAGRHLPEIYVLKQD